MSTFTSRDKYKVRIETGMPNKTLTRKEQRERKEDVKSHRTVYFCPKCQTAWQMSEGDLIYYQKWIVGDVDKVCPKCVLPLQSFGIS